MDQTTGVVKDVNEMLVEFAAEHQELMEALKIFGIASAEYERALSALYPSTIYSSTSSRDSQ